MQPGKEESTCARLQRHPLFRELADDRFLPMPVGSRIGRTRVKNPPYRDGEPGQGYFRPLRGEVPDPDDAGRPEALYGVLQGPVACRQQLRPLRRLQLVGGEVPAFGVEEEKWAVVD